MISFGIVLGTGFGRIELVWFSLLFFIFLDFNSVEVGWVCVGECIFIFLSARK